MATVLPVKMSIPQYNDFRKAKDNKDNSRAQAIMDLGYQSDYDPTDVGASEAEIIDEEYTNDNILDDVAGGLTNKEIYEKYDISPAKLVSIKKGAK